MGFSMGVRVYEVEVGFFLCGGVWFFQCFYLAGLGVGLLVSLRLRYRLLWIWVFGLRSSYGSFGGVGVEV